MTGRTIPIATATYLTSRFLRTTTVKTPGIDRPPIIVAYPTNRVATAGTTSSFSVTAKGSEPFHYQWRQNGQEIHGETNATLTLTNLLPVNSGAYDVVITNAFGQSASPPAELVVSQPDGYASHCRQRAVRPKLQFCQHRCSGDRDFDCFQVEPFSTHGMAHAPISARRCTAGRSFTRSAAIRARRMTQPM